MLLVLGALRVEGRATWSLPDRNPRLEPVLLDERADTVPQLPAQTDEAKAARVLALLVAARVCDGWRRITSAGAKGKGEG